MGHRQEAKLLERAQRGYPLKLNEVITLAISLGFIVHNGEKGHRHLIDKSKPPIRVDLPHGNGSKDLKIKIQRGIVNKLLGIKSAHATG
jgi:hypothetical protein